MLVGYIEFVALLFLPGFAFTELLRLRTSSLSDSLAIWFCLSFSLATLSLIVRTSGYTVAGVVLAGVYPGTINLMLGLSAVVLISSVLLRHEIHSSLRPARLDVAVILITGALGLMVLFHFAKYPIFPQFSSIDFDQHVVLTVGLQDGRLSSFPAGILYNGVHTLMAALLALSGGTPLVETQRAMGVLATLSVLPFYSAARALTGSEHISVISLLVYVGGGFVWFASVFNAGLYPNFYGILSILFIIIAIALVSKEPKRISSWVIYSVSLANASFSHYSVVTILPAIILLPIIGFIFTRKVQKPLVGLALLPVVPALAIFAAAPGALGTLISFTVPGGAASLTNDTTISSLFLWSPFLRYLIAEITGDTATLFILGMAALGAYFTSRQRNPLTWLPLVWFISVALAAPQSATAWRFSYMALIPLTIISSMGFSFLLPSARKTVAIRHRNRRPTTERRNRLILVSVIVVLMVAGSWGTLLIEDAALYTEVDGQAQQDVYQSMLWFASNTPPGSKLLSVTDSRYVYTGLIAHRSFAYSPLISPDDVISQVRGQSDVYVVLTNVATLTTSREDYVNLLGAYQENQNFELVYHNDDVMIYSLKPSIPQG